MNASALADTAARLLATEVRGAVPLSGGDLSTVYRLTLADGRRVIAKPGPDVLAESEMLAAIAATGAPAPDVLGVGEGLLVMAELAADGTSAWDDLASVLNRLHGAVGERYGWHHDIASAASRFPTAGRTTGHASGPTTACAVTCRTCPRPSRAASKRSPTASPSISRAIRIRRCFTATSGAATSSSPVGG